MLRPVGEIDLATAPAIDRQLERLHAAGYAELVLDLRAVPFMDSSGLRVVLRWNELAAKERLRVRPHPRPGAGAARLPGHAHGRRADVHRRVNADTGPGRYGPAGHAPNQDRRHHRPRLARPRGARADGRGGDGRGPAELLPRQRRRARRDRAARPRGRRSRRPPGRHPAGPARARSCASASCATASSSSSPATRDVLLRRPDGGEGDASRLHISWPGLASTVEPDEVIYLADGAVRLRVEAVRAGRAARSTPWSRSAARSPRARGSTSRARPRRCPAVPEEDLEHLRTGERIGVDMVALSFVRRAEDVRSCASTRGSR